MRNAARNADQRAQLNETAALSQALRAPLNAPPATGPVLPPNFAETARPPTLPDFAFAAPTTPSDAGGGTRPEIASAQAATTSPAAPPALPPVVPSGAAAFADSVRRFAGAAAGRTIPVVSALNQIFASEPALAPGLSPEQDALVGRRLLDATPLAGQAVALKPPFLTEGFTAPPAAIGVPPAALAPVPGAVAGPLPGFTPPAPEPGLEGLTFPPAFGPLPGFAAAPPLGLAVPGLMPAGQTPPLPGFDSADPGLAGSQPIEQRGLTTPTGPINGVPAGERSITEVSGAPKTKKQVDSENLISDRLAALGYTVVQNPTRGAAPALTPDRLQALGLKAGKDPDLLVEGRVFDIYTPIADKLQSIRNGIAKKIGEGQTQRIVLDLRDTTQTDAAIRATLRDNPVPGLREVITLTTIGFGRAYP